MRFFQKYDITRANVDLALADLPFATPKGTGKEDLHVLPVNLDDVDMKQIVDLINHCHVDASKLIILDVQGERDFPDIPKKLKRTILARAVFRKSEARNYRVLPLPATINDLGHCEGRDFAFDASYLVSLSGAADVSAFDSLRAAAKSPRAPMIGSMPSREMAIINGLTNTFTEKGADGIVRVKPSHGVTHQQVLDGLPSGDAVAVADRGFLVDARTFNAEADAIPVERYGQSWGDDRPAEDVPGEANMRAFTRNVFGKKLILNTGGVPFAELRASLSKSRAGVAVARFGSAPSRLWEIASAGRCAVLVGDVVKLPGEDVGADYSWIIARVSRDEASEAGQIAAQTLKWMSDDDIVALGRKARETFERFILPSSWLRWIPSAVEKL